MLARQPELIEEAMAATPITTTTTMRIQKMPHQSIGPKLGFGSRSSRSS